MSVSLRVLHHPGQHHPRYLLRDEHRVASVIPTVARALDPSPQPVAVAAGPGILLLLLVLVLVVLLGGGADVVMSKFLGFDGFFARLDVGSTPAAPSATSST